METYNVAKAVKAQVEYCSRTGYPQFAPLRGQCFKCGRNIYEKIEKDGQCTGVSVERAGSFLITGCPHCNISYCD